ncbi:methionyl-tRNA formyltransferase [Powellomyces hirtus]|uniref:Methionyl-tRNA formyltransferase, mitochondrial n=1 Tax=Powellomyces hirtus TaxID=109895 RepID=A0A507E6H5_9FUNG|nr:methionyl-tRNA formyltransferase [Powellomyces hirtus]
MLQVLLPIRRARRSLRNHWFQATAAFHHRTPLYRPLSLLFFGSDEFSIACLQKLHQEHVSRPSSVIKHIEVVTPPDNPRNKVSQVPLKKFAESVGLTVHAAPSKTLRDWKIPEASEKFDLAVVVSFGYFLPRRIIGAFESGALNVHPSLLPRYRGAAPLQYTILNDDREGGVSIIELDDKRFDVGRILKQSRVDVAPKTYFRDLHDQLASIGASDLLDVIKELDQHKTDARLQEEEKASLAPKIPKSMAVIDWSRNAEDVYKLYRAIGQKIPLHTTFRGRRVQLMKIEDPDISQMPEAAPGVPESPPIGTLRMNPSRTLLYIRCNDSWLACSTVKVEGKNEVGIRDFSNGYQLSNVTEERFE